MSQIRMLQFALLMGAVTALISLAATIATLFKMRLYRDVEPTPIRNLLRAKDGVTVFVSVSLLHLTLALLFSVSK